MTTPEQDATLGRTIRESKEADAELTRLLLQAEFRADQLERLAEDLRARVKRARRAAPHLGDGAGTYAPLRGGPVSNDQGLDEARLRECATVANIEEISALDREIGAAVAKASTCYRRKTEALNL